MSLLTSLNDGFELVKPSDLNRLALIFNQDGCAIESMECLWRELN